MQSADNEVEDERENLYDLPLRVEDWSADDVSHWLINQGFVSVVESFYMADIRGVGLLHLSLRDLEEELPISDASLRNAVFNAIQKLKATREVPPCSLYPFKLTHVFRFKAFTVI